MNNMTYGVASIRSKLSKKMTAEDCTLEEVEGYKYYGYKKRMTNEYNEGCLNGCDGWERVPEEGSLWCAECNAEQKLIEEANPDYCYHGERQGNGEGQYKMVKRSLYYQKNYFPGRPPSWGVKVEVECKNCNIIHRSWCESADAEDGDLDTKYSHIIDIFKSAEHEVTHTVSSKSCLEYIK